MIKASKIAAILVLINGIQVVSKDIWNKIGWMVVILY